MAAVGRGERSGMAALAPASLSLAQLLCRPSRLIRPTRRFFSRRGHPLSRGEERECPLLIPEKHTMIPTPKFPLGQLVTTPALMDDVHPEDALECLARHAAGDWGDLDEDDRVENELALMRGFRLFRSTKTAQE